MEFKSSILRDSVLALNLFTGTDGIESNFFRFHFWVVHKLETLKDFNMQKSTWSNLSEWRFAVLIAMANPLEFSWSMGATWSWQKMHYRQVVDLPRSRVVLWLWHVYGNCMKFPFGQVLQWQQPSCLGQGIWLVSHLRLSETFYNLSQSFCHFWEKGKSDSILNCAYGTVHSLNYRNDHLLVCIL